MDAFLSPPDEKTQIMQFDMGSQDDAPLQDLITPKVYFWTDDDSL